MQAWRENPVSACIQCDTGEDVRLPETSISFFLFRFVFFSFGTGD